MRVLDVEVVATRLDLLGRHFPRLRRFLAALALRPAPPLDAALQVLEADRFGHRIGFLAFWHAVLVEPDVLGRLAFLEKQKVGTDRGVGLEHRIGQADDGVEVTLLHQMFLEPRLHAFAEQSAIRQHYGSASASFEQSYY